MIMISQIIMNVHFNRILTIKNMESGKNIYNPTYLLCWGAGVGTSDSCVNPISYSSTANPTKIEPVTSPPPGNIHSGLVLSKPQPNLNTRLGLTI